jgi:hypothetical protein
MRRASAPREIAYHRKNKLGDLFVPQGNGRVDMARQAAKCDAIAAAGLITQMLDSNRQSEENHPKRLLKHDSNQAQSGCPAARPSSDDQLVERPPQHFDTIFDSALSAHQVHISYILGA